MGFPNQEHENRYLWFKLDLDSSQVQETSELARKHPNRKALPPGYDLPIDNLGSDYLRELRGHAEKVLSRKIGEAVLQSTPIEYIITVPAVWSESAQEKTRTCAEMAGMGQGSKLQVVSEPEAAAIYALDAMNPHHLRIGDTFVLCDAGGGTVDLISYSISQLYPVLQIKEAAPGDGKVCGSTFLNRIFHEYLEENFGSDPGWDEENIDDAIEKFEKITKRRFTGRADEEHVIRLHGIADNPAKGVMRGRMRMTGVQLCRIFDPVINDVVSLVQKQIKATKTEVKAILLVGGFAESPYLTSAIRAAVGSKVEVMKPPNGWTAVVRGALIKGLSEVLSGLASIKVESRVARKHYGIRSNVKYDRDKHDKRKRSLYPPSC